MIKDGKIFGKINIFDCFVVLMIIVFIIGVGSKFSIFKGDKSNKVSVEYEMLVKAVREETINSFEVGQDVFFTNTSYNIGKIKEIKYENASELMETIDGRIIEAPIENRYNLTLIIESDNGMLDSKQMVLVSSQKIMQGREMTFDTQKNRCQGTINKVIIK